MPFELCLKCQHNKHWFGKGEPHVGYGGKVTQTCGHGREYNDPCGCHCKEWLMFSPEALQPTERERIAMFLEMRILRHWPHVGHALINAAIQEVRSGDYVQAIAEGRTGIKAQREHVEF